MIRLVAGVFVVAHFFEEICIFVILGPSIDFGCETERSLRESCMVSSGYPLKTSLKCLEIRDEKQNRDGIEKPAQRYERKHNGYRSQQKCKEGKEWYDVLSPH